MKLRVGKNTNISKKQYRKLVSAVEHEPLIYIRGLTAAGFFAAAAILAGILVWYAKTNPGNLTKTTAIVTGISKGRVDSTNRETTFVTFNFSAKNGENYTVRQPGGSLNYEPGQEVSIGYHPENPNYARNLADNRPPALSLYLWLAPGFVASTLVAIALWRYRLRQQLIWDAAEAADVD